MCGIFCVIGKSDKIKKIGKNGIKSLFHRGPDRSNTIEFQMSNTHGVISHSRLSIVGLGQSGDQPKVNGKYILAFNGEIYGVSAGCSLRDSGIHSDTEYLWNQLRENSNLSIENGIDGIWAIAIIDLENNELKLLRDPNGVIPLFLYSTNDYFVISSEVQAIAKAIGKLEINKCELIESVAVRQLSYGRYIKGLEQILPGEVRRYRFENGLAKLISTEVTNSSLVSHESLFNSLRDSLDNAISKQVEADVPVGLQLSGGVDSTLLASTLARLGHRHLTPFVATFGGSGDEGVLALENTKRLGIRPPLQVEITKNSFSNQILETIHNFDPAFSHPNFFAIQQISKAAKDEGVKVLLCGEGSDEIFRGYTRLLPSNVLSLLNTRLAHRMLIAVEKRRLNFDWCANVDVESIFNRNTSRNYNWIADPSIRHLFANYLHELLYRQNIACMSNSVEARVPFLDFSVLSYALQNKKSFFSNLGIKPIFLKGEVNRTLHNDFPEYRGFSRKNGFALPAHTLLNNEVLSIIERSVKFSKVELGIDRSAWWKRFKKGEITAFQFERTLWPALLTAGALAASGNTL